MSRPNSISRRRFLGSAAAAFAAPLVIRSSALGAGATTAPSQRINLGFIGVGKQAYGHLCTFASREDCQVVAVCDVQETKRQTAKEAVEQRYAQRKAADSSRQLALYNDFRELLTRARLRQALAESQAWTPIESPCTVPRGLPGTSSRGVRPISRRMS
jgi:hypothetical protein